MAPKHLQHVTLDTPQLVGVVNSGLRLIGSCSSASHARAVHERVASLTTTCEGVVEDRERVRRSAGHGWLLQRRMLSGSQQHLCQ